MSDSYVKVNLSDSLLQNYDTGDSVVVYSEFPNGNYNNSKYTNDSLIISSSSVTEAFPSSSSHANYFESGTIKRNKNYDLYKLHNNYRSYNYSNENPRYKVSQYITTNDRNWSIWNSKYHTSTDTLYSGAGNDTIEYMDVVFAGGGNDIIQICGGNVRGGTGNDSIYCDSTNSIKKQNTVVFEAQNGTDVITGSVDIIQWEAGYTGISVGRYYDNCYKSYLGMHSGNDAILLGTNDKFVKIVNSGGDEIAQVYLESDSDYYYTSSIDGSKYNSLEVLIGNKRSDTIKAGTGGSSLWGGVGGDDSLICGAGSDQIFYGDNDNIDYIINSDAADRVVLYGSLSFQSISQAGNDLVIQYTPDNKLTVKNWSENGMNNFQIYDGSVWGIHFENGTPTYYRKG